MNLHVAGYTRQSYGRVTGSEASPASQREANQGRYDSFAAEMARQGREAVWCGHYEDVGISAFSGTERPDFERLLRDCRLGRINVVVIYNISRLSRLEPRDAIPIVNELMSLGVTIVSVAEGVFRPDEVMDLIHLIFRLDAAYQESKNKSTAVRDAAALARSLGGYVGGKAPFGRRLNQETRSAPNGKPVAVQTLVTQLDEAEVIRRIVKALLAGTDSVHSICATLNAEGVATLGASRGKRTSGSSWHPKTVITMLRHPHLAGFDAEAVYDASGRRVTGHRIRRDAEGKPVRVWDPILSEADYFAVQDWLDARPKRMNEHRTTALLSSMGIMECACGCSMSANNAERPSYFCNRPAGKPLTQSPGDHEGRSYISRSALDDHVVRSIFALLDAAEWDAESREILERVTVHYAEVNETPETAQERSAVMQERADATRALTQLYDDRELFAGDPVGRARWQEDIKTQQARLSAADSRLEVLGQAGSMVLPISGWAESDNGDPLGPGSWWESASLAARREFVALFCKRITVRKALAHEKSRGSKASAVIEGRVSIEWV